MQWFELHHLQVELNRTYLVSQKVSAHFPHCVVTPSLSFLETALCLPSLEYCRLDKHGVSWGLTLEVLSMWEFSRVRGSGTLWGYT